MKENMIGNVLHMFSCNNSDPTTKGQMKKLMLLSTSVLKQHPSLAYWYVILMFALINNYCV